MPCFCKTNDNNGSVSNESGTLSRLFKLPQHGTTVRTELIAGMTTFLTMVYIVFVNPQILGAAQMDPKVVFVTTCLIAGIGSIAMGIFANLPVALAPAMGLNAFFAFVVVGAMGISWQTGMGAIFWGAVGLFLLTLFRIRYWMISNIPLSLRIGITSGIGLFIALMGLKNTGVIVANKDTLVMPIRKLKGMLEIIQYRIRNSVSKNSPTAPQNIAPIPVCQE
ncbi:solute carrier family 23 protein, partial [Escherichia sp. TWPC-MK]